MKGYGYKKPEYQENTSDKQVAATENALPAVEATFAKAAYEWNNALLIAAEKMWGKKGG